MDYRRTFALWNLITLHPKRFILPILLLTALAHDAAGQPAGPDSILITDQGTNRLIRVTDLSDTGVQLGPTVSGLSLNIPWHLGLDSSGRIYIAEGGETGNLLQDFRIVRMDDVAGNGWKAVTSVQLGIPPPFAPGGGYMSSVTTDRAGRIYINAAVIIRIDDMNGA